MAVSHSSVLFSGHRALGFVSDHVPLVVRYIHSRREHLIVTSVGKSFHTYGGNKLGLLSVSGIHPENINVLATDTYMVYAAAGKNIYAWRRGTELKHVYKGHTHMVRLVLPFGPHLVSIDDSSMVKVFDIVEENQVLEIPFDKRTFEISAVAHPPTYKDKILLGSRQGSLQLWNLKSAKKIYKFKGWQSSVTCLEPCGHVVDCVAIGLQSGDIIVHNLKFDQSFVKFKQDWGPVTGLSFRRDRNDLLVSGGGSSGRGLDDHSIGGGHIAIWNMDDQKLAAQIRDAHDGEIAGLQCLSGEPILVTSSPDNSVKQWIFDMPDGGGRLLRLREGHAEPPNKIRFYGSLGNVILSAGQDSALRSFSTVTDLLNRSFGVASLNRKLAKKHKRLDNPVRMHPITDFTIDTTKEQEWDNIACVHDQTTTVTTWSFGRQKMGDVQLRHPRFKEDSVWRQSVASCLCLSVCGNFALIGYTSGHVDKYNIQSGIFRGSFVSNQTDAAHPGATIRGIVSDGLNQLVVTGCAQGLLKFWRFKDHQLLAQHSSIQDLEMAAVRQMALSRESGLLAVSLEDLSVHILDIFTRKVVRKFAHVHPAPLTDLSLSRDSRWLMTSSLDKTLKVWDIPSGNLIDNVAFPSPIKSFSLSPNNEYLATTHLDSVAIYLWSNRSLYGHVAIKPLDQELDQPREIRMMPSVRPSQPLVDPIVDMPNEASEEDDEDMEAEWYKNQITDELVTLAGLPAARWQNLINLDVIKARNKPKESLSVAKPNNAPFFLPTVSGPDGQTRFNLEQQPAAKNKSGQAKAAVLELTPFAQDLWDSSSMSLDKARQLIKALEDKGPSAIDLEIASLGPESTGSVQLIKTFMHAIKLALSSRTEYEAVQAYLGLLFKHHSDTIMTEPDFQEDLEELGQVLEQCWSDLKESLGGAATLVAFAKNALVSG